ncbi:MAG: PilX N-terminal domain-containing pilus assembly protein [Candidatus Methylumidiphilus sp.]
MKTKYHQGMGFRESQKGVALIVSLLILLVLTLTGITAMLVSSLEERMSGNLRDRNLAFQAAESALRAGEDAVAVGLNQATMETFGCQNTTTCALESDLEAASSAWSGHNSRAVAYTGTLGSVASSPKYLIEVLTPTPLSMMGTAPLVAGEFQKPQSPLCYYRISALGTGGTSTATVVVQSTYIHPTVKGACHG